MDNWISPLDIDSSFSQEKIFLSLPSALPSIILYVVILLAPLAEEKRNFGYTRQPTYVF